MSNDYIEGLVNTEKYDQLERWPETANREFRYMACGYLMQHFDTIKKRERYTIYNNLNTIQYNLKVCLQ